MTPIMLATRCALPQVVKTLLEILHAKKQSQEVQHDDVLLMTASTTSNKNKSSRWGNYSLLHFAAEGPGADTNWSEISFDFSSATEKKELEEMVQNNLSLVVKELLKGSSLSSSSSAEIEKSFLVAGCSCKGKFLDDSRIQTIFPAVVTPVLLAIMHKNVGPLRAFIELNIPHGYPKNDSADSDDDNNVIEFAEKFGDEIHEIVKTAPIGWVCA